ncbi:MAG: acetyltransferase [Spirochaetia bacterium]|nr:acetyltransferase [Spirochaetia bacterium]
MEKIFLIGGGGHCKSCIDVIEKENKYEIAGIFDIHINNKEKLFNYNYLGSDEKINDFMHITNKAHISIGAIKNCANREKIYNELKIKGIEFPVIISSLSYISKYAIIEEGSIIMHNALINASANIQKNSIINSNALIEHDVTIGEHSHISTSAVINGGCVIGSKVFIGSNSVINNQIKIADNVIVGSGSVVISDINDAGIYAGIPAKKIK